MIKVYNSLSKQKEELIPLEKDKIKMYVCGVTVYDYLHLGHARAYVAFDVIRRFLEYQGYSVVYVQNFTDIDDKIIKKAQENNQTTSQITEKYIKAYFEDIEKMNIKPATFYPKATESIADIIELIKAIEAKGYAYSVDGDVFFSVRKFADYGQLSHRDFSNNEAGARISIDQRKQDPFDFVLWKSSKPSEPFWESPWGNGRPGWHIECSAMSMKKLGNNFDIHGGGADLIFPHHENEIAQSKAATGCNYAKYWIHNGFVNINNEKMSKSTGNFFTLREILDKYSANIIRLFLLGTHYRAPINYEDSFLEEASKSWQRIQDTIDQISLVENNDQAELSEYKKDFINAMSDDFNAAEALGHIFNLVKYCNKNNSQNAAELIKELLSVLGFDLSKAKNNNIPAEVEKLAQERDKARTNKDYQKSDELRDQIAKIGFIIKDTPRGYQLIKK